MKLEVQATGGNPKFPRYLIANDQGEVHDGTGWTKDRKKAILYIHNQELAQTFRTLEEAMWNHAPKREFKVTLNIVVRSEGQYTKEQLATYLEQAAAILLDHSKGTGPIEESMTQLAVNWNEMREKKAVSEDETKR